MSEGLPVHSFQTLLHDLAVLARNRVRCAVPGAVTAEQRRSGAEVLWAAWCLSIVASKLLMVPHTISAQLEIAPNAEYRLDGHTYAWSDLEAVDAYDSLVVVLTDSPPFLHLFRLADGSHVLSWGEMGDGPGEFRSPAGVSVDGSRIYVLDTERSRLSVYDLAGELVLGVDLRTLGMGFPNRLERGKDGTVVIQVPTPMTPHRTVISWAIGAEETDTIIAYDLLGDRLRLSAPGAPGLTVRRPFAASQRWTTANGSFVYWDGGGAEMRVTGLNDATERTLSLNNIDLFPVTEADRDAWLASAIPGEFMGQRGVFDPLRAVARETVSFPDAHPLVLALLGATDGSVWVQRRRSSEGQLWDVIDPLGRASARVSLLAGDVLAVVVGRYALVRSKDDMEVESVEVYSLIGHSDSGRWDP